MKKFSICLSVLFIYFYIFNVLNVNAIEQSKTVLIETHEEDLTGDGLKEIIKLKGTLLSENSNYYHSVWAEVTNQFSKKWEIQFGGAYKPSLTFIDFSNDQLQSMLFQSASEEDFHHYSLFTLKNGKVEEIDLPKQHYITGYFQNNFIIHLQLSPHKKPISISVKDREELYIKQNLYNNQGQLLKETPVILQPISKYRPIYLNERNGFGLKSYQPLSGVNISDEIGGIETLWFYEDDQWIILQTNWVLAQNK